MTSKERARVRIGLVTPGYPPEMGGVETVVAALALGIAEAGHGLRVLTHRPAGRVARRQPVTPDVLRFADWTRSRRFRIAPGLWRHLRRQGGEYDLLHAHSFHGSAAAAAAFMTDRPLVFSPHYHGVGHTPAARAAHQVYDRLAGRMFARAGAIICVSTAEAGLLAAHYPRTQDRLVVIPNGVDLAPILAAEPYPVERPVVLAAGRLESYKQVDLTVRAMTELGDADLVVLGTGPTMPELQRLAADLGVAQRVSFRGYVDDLELRRWQRTATVTVTMSQHEAFGLGPLEASVAGSQVVASAIPAHRELAGSLARPPQLLAAGASSTEVADAVRQALAAGRGEPGPGAVLGWPEVTRRTLEVYQTVLA